MNHYLPTKINDLRKVKKMYMSAITEKNRRILKNIGK